MVKYTKSIPKVTSLHGIESAPNYLAQTINCNNSRKIYKKQKNKVTSLHANGLDPNYLPESTENSGFFPVYNTELLVKNFNASKTELLHKIPYNKESHKSSNDINNSEYEKFIEFSRIDDIINELKNISASNNDSIQVLANELKNAVKAMNDSVKNQTELTSSIKSFVEEFKKNKNN